jgi:hypothetical protein
MKYFDIKRDLRIIKNGGFMCNGCLVGKPLSQQSPRDARYCIDCQPIIEYEYALAAEHRGYKSGYKPVAPDANLEAIEPPLRELGAGEEKTKMSTLNENPVTVDKFKVSPPKSRFWKGRPETYKKRELPDELIRQLSFDDMGSKAIATKLKADMGIGVSYKTIQRILSGKRVSENKRG